MTFFHSGECGCILVHGRDVVAPGLGGGRYPSMFRCGCRYDRPGLGKSTLGLWLSCVFRLDLVGFLGPSHLCRIYFVGGGLPILLNGHSNPLRLLSCFWLRLGCPLVLGRWWLLRLLCLVIVEEIWRPLTSGIPLDDLDRLNHFRLLSVVLVGGLLGGLAGGRMLWRGAVIADSWVLLEVVDFATEVFYFRVGVGGGFEFW
ncbi:hypothetical protein OUZ56_024644 [Daphnia magna]|uniref:Uncharacterized protein n=1 Tax=Daphnia magna TaxID=35525 RepID=A0ABR0B152_9CRUS|nr:hypothetical protein OUZ56_024644 [Daphnia magna]